MIGRTEHVYADRTIKHQTTKWVPRGRRARTLEKAIGRKGKVHLSTRAGRRSSKTLSFNTTITLGNNSSSYTQKMSGNRAVLELHSRLYRVVRLAFGLSGEMPDKAGSSNGSLAGDQPDL